MSPYLPWVSYSQVVSRSRGRALLFGCKETILVKSPTRCSKLRRYRRAGFETQRRKIHFAYIFHWALPRKIHFSPVCAQALLLIMSLLYSETSTTHWIWDRVQTSEPNIQGSTWRAQLPSLIVYTCSTLIFILPWTINTHYQFRSHFCILFSPIR